MAQPSIIPQDLTRAALLHFENGVPIDDTSCRKENKRRLARVHHVYWQWVRNPLLDARAMFYQLCKQEGFADKSTCSIAAKKDKMLFDFVVEHVSLGNRHEDEALVRAAAKQSIRIGMETDNVTALTKGGKLLYDVAGLAQPEDEKADLSKVAFLPSVVVTDISQVDDTKEAIDDAEMKRIMAKYGAHVDEKRQMIEERVELLEARGSATDEADRQATELPEPSEQEEPSEHREN